MSIASAAVQENDAAPLVKDKQRKFTPDNAAKIKSWVAQGVRRDEIASRLKVTVGSLQVTCSRLGVSLRKSSLANGNGTIPPHSVIQRSIELAAEGTHSAQAKFTLLLKAQNRQAAFDLPLRAGLVEQLVLHASVRGESVVDLIGKILSQVVQKDLVGELL